MVREEIQKIDKQMHDKQKVMEEYEKDIKEDEYNVEQFKQRQETELKDLEDR